MRNSCVECVVKHIGQAAALMGEIRLGYEHHWVYAIGHLAEAESEAVNEFPDIARQIRNWRIDYMNGDNPDLDVLVEHIYKWRNVNVGYTN